MDLRQWITAEHASVADRLTTSIIDLVPKDRWRDPVGDGGSSIAHLLHHVSYHEDLAVNAAVRRTEPLMATWRSRLGTASLPAHAGLGEAEEPALTAALDVDTLVDYARAVHAGTAEWLGAVDLGCLDDVPDALAALEGAGVAATAVPWLHKMWSGKPVAFFVQWEAIGHRVNHLGEMVSVRNRLGLSPF